MRRHLIRALLALALPFGLAACQGDGSSSDEGWTPPSDVATEPDPLGFSLPGATFDLEGEAHVQYIDDGIRDELPVETTLTIVPVAAPEEGSADDLPDDGQDMAEGRTVWLVRFQVTNTGRAGGASNLLTPRLFDDTGDSMEYFGTSTADCAATLPEPGQTGEVCGFAFGDGSPAAVAYDQDDTVYENEPIYWRLV